MSFQEISISRIKPNPQNARTHSPKQIRQIADSIIALGFRNPLLVNEHDELIAGHGRFKAAELLGLKTVPVIVVAGLSQVQQRALAIADNKIAQNAGWDRERLAIEIPELAELLAAEGLDVSLLGFEPIEIARLETEFEPTASSRRRNGMVPDGIDPRWGEAPVVSKTGDLWLLGDHALLCGDACSADDLVRLMGDHRASVAFLDPRDVMTCHCGDAAAGTETTAVDFPGVLSGAFAAAAAVTREGGVHFVCADWQHLGALMAAALPVYGAPVDGAVWVQSDMRAGALYRGQRELVAVFAVGPPRLQVGCRTKRLRSSMWHYPGITWPGSVHGRQAERVGKPVALIADALKDTTRRGDIVLDIFAGTGTTILAAQRVQRHARALEVDPRLVDIAIHRWQAATRVNAVHAETGLSFDEVAAPGRRSEPVLSPLPHQGAQP